MEYRDPGEKQEKDPNKQKPIIIGPTIAKDGTGSYEARRIHIILTIFEGTVDYTDPVTQQNYKKKKNVSVPVGPPPLVLNKPFSAEWDGEKALVKLGSRR